MWMLLVAAALTAVDPAELEIGPHAREAAAHAADAPAAWISAPVPTARALSSPQVSRRVYGYAPYWVALDLAGFPWELVTDVVTFSAGIAPDGAISNPHSLPGSALVAAAHSHGVKVHVCATLFNSGASPSEISVFLGSGAAQGRAIQSLVGLVQSSGADGLNLDFEFVGSGSRSAFTAFVQQAHAALRSAVPGAELTIAMPSSTGYSGYDAAQLSAATERLLLMEYDYHWRTAPNAGPNAPLTSGGVWPGSVESAVGGFLAAAPARSLALGVPYYGYDWPTSTSAPGSATTGSGATILIKDFYGKAATFGRLWDAPSQTPWFRRAGGQGWCDDDQSLALKYQFVNSKQLAGIMIWALSYDAGRAEMWSALRAAFGQPAPGAEGRLELMSATFAPVDVQAGGLVTATARVKNVGGQTIADMAPSPATIYDETQSATGSVAGSWRLAADIGDRPAGQEAHPFRWGIGKALAAGEETTITAQVRLDRTGARTIWAAVIHEGAAVVRDNVGTTRITVTSADGGAGGGSGSPDAGASDGGPLADGGAAGAPGDGGVDPIGVERRGCAQAGSAWFAVAGCAAALIRRRRRRD